ncbi:MAG: Zn-ribbon domain-containing OB-fold protein [Solimonas sp.]
MSEIQPERQYREFLAQGRFMIQRARGSGRYLFYPRVAEPVTGDTNLEWVEASGQGTVYSTTVVRKRSPEPSYSVVLVDLAEGPRLMSRVIGLPPEDVRIGMPVHARIIDDGGSPLLVFEAAQENP